MPIPSFLLEQKEREIQQALANLRALPSLTRSEVGNEDSCPICLLPLESVCEEEGASEGKGEGSSDGSLDGASPIQATGVVKLASCGHIFCRKDLAEWIESHHGSCPTCRRTFFEFTIIDEAEYESSDGGEYLPEEDEDNEWLTEDDFDLVTSSEVDYEMDDDDEMPEEDESEDEGNWGGYRPLAQVPSDVDLEADGTSASRSLLPHGLNAGDDFVVHTSEFESDAPVDDNTEVSGELSYGSDSLSEETSFKTDNTSEANGVDTCVGSDKLEIDRSEVETSKDVVEHSKSKSTSIFSHGPSGMHNEMQ